MGPGLNQPPDNKTNRDTAPATGMHDSPLCALLHGKQLSQKLPVFPLIFQPDSVQ
jgi:hypothetical protein